MEGKFVYISEASIGEYLHKRLIKAGYAPSADEVLDIAEFMFDYLIELGVIRHDEIEEEE